MSTFVRRAARVTAVLCSLLALAPLAASAAPVAAPRAMTIVEGRFPVYAHAPVDLPRAAEARPVTVYLHGMCGDPANGCNALRDGVTDRSWLLCPSAPASCPGGGAIWNAPFATKTATIENAEQELLAAHPAQVDLAKERVLIGFSQGAYLARDLLQAPAQRGHYRGVLFIGATIEVSVAELRAAGVRRAAFAAGRYDMTYRALARTAAALSAAGFEARFVDLGPVGHTYVPQRDEPVLRDALSWLEASY